MRHKHDEVIQHSVDIIKEIDEVSSTLLLPQSLASNESGENITRIKQLIHEFEGAKNASSQKVSTAPTIESKVDIRKILQNFEQLNESHVLKESLVLFKRAKESFEKIDTFFDKLGTSRKKSDGGGPDGPNDENNNDSVSVGGGAVGVSNSGVSDGCGKHSSLKHKINMFNGGKEFEKTPSRYASCCSSIMSIEAFRSTEDIVVAEVNSSVSSENGYEGDNDDSEYDLFAAKKKSKHTPPNE